MAHGKKRAAASAYHPGRAIDNARAIGEGNLQILVDYLHDLHGIPYQHDGAERARLLEERAGWGLIYAEALRAHVAGRGAGRPREVFTIADAMRALEAVREYQAELEKNPNASKARIAARLQQRHGISRAIFRAALNGVLPEAELPGIPRAGK